MKVCINCNISRNDTDYYDQGRGNNRTANSCKYCHANRRKQYRAAHPGRDCENARNQRRVNPEISRRATREYYKRNKAKCLANSNKYYASKLHATPLWLTKEQLEEIRWYYETAAELQWLCNEPLHVDHIHPLRGETAWGLHVPWNLQIISRSQNLSKNNKQES